MDSVWLTIVIGLFRVLPITAIWRCYPVLAIFAYFSFSKDGLWILLISILNSPSNHWAIDRFW